MTGRPITIEQRLVSTIASLSRRITNLEVLATDPVALGTTLNRTALGSSNYVPGTSGFVLNADGTGELTSDITIVGANGTTVVLGPTEPSDPTGGEFWFNTSSGTAVMEVYDEGTSEWVVYQYGTSAIADNSIIQALLSDNAVGTAQLIDASVGQSQLADDAVGQPQLIDGAVGAAQIADDAVGSAAIASAAVGLAALNSAVTARALGGITTTIASSAPGSPAAGDLWVNSSSGFQLEQYSGSAWTAISWNAADVLAAGSVGATLLSGSITARSLGGITTTIAGSAPGSPVAGDIWINSASGYQINQYSGSAWVAVSFTASDVLTAGSVTASLLSGSVTARTLGGITTTIAGSAPGSPIAGDIWIDSANGYQLQQYSGSAWTAVSFTASDVITAGTITSGLIEAQAITTSLIAAGAVTASQIAANTITAAQIAAGTITGSLIEAATITGSLIAAGTITAANIVANTITATQIAAGAITAVQIAAGTIVASNIAANTITASQIAASTITGSLIAAGTITATEIAAATITADLIAASTITGSLIAAGTIAASNLVADIVVAGIVNSTTIETATLVSAVIQAGTITGTSIVVDGSSGEFLAYSGTPATSNLVVSVSPVSGTDGYSNTYPAGLGLYNSNTKYTTLAASTAGNLVLGTGSAGGGGLEMVTQSGTPANQYALFYADADGNAAFKSANGFNGQLTNTIGAVPASHSASTGSQTAVTPSFSIPANDAAPGTTYRITAFGTGSYSSSNLNWNTLAYGNTEAEAAAASLPSVFTWYAVALITVETIGSSGTAWYTTVVHIGEASGTSGATPSTVMGVSSTAISVNTTASTTMSITAAVAGTCTIVGQAAIFERIGP